MKHILLAAAVVGLSAGLTACGGGGGGAKDQLAKNADCADKKQDENSRMAELQRKEADGTITDDEKKELDGIYQTNKERSKTDGDCQPASPTPAQPGA